MLSAMLYIACALYQAMQCALNMTQAGAQRACDLLALQAQGHLYSALWMSRMSVCRLTWPSSTKYCAARCRQAWPFLNSALAAS